ncbi:collagen-like triple helix repeat-containing protein [Streptomyces marispadix]|uniref:Collagen-like protein n=1 Tax=Streptomyces marispadix TaxID=2922868 RepID=A0ABS9T6E8_9ACTN|nr:collagen-like protein [Streptomyces marispadix]MCH6164038.1 collagen-like protein [Streptomyces marispadix]
MKGLLRDRRRAYTALVVGLVVSYVPLAALTAMVLYAFGVREGFEDTKSMRLSELPTVVAFLVVAGLVARVRAFVGAEGPVTGPRTRAQVALMAAECLGVAFLAVVAGDGLIDASLVGAGVSSLITGLRVTGWVRTLPPPPAPDPPRRTSTPAPGRSGRPGSVRPRGRPGPAGPRGRPGSAGPRGRFTSPRPVRRESEAPPSKLFDGRTPPAPGDIWFAEVPFDEGTGSKDRPCLVVRTLGSHAEVLKITSVDKSSHRNYARISTTSWGAAGEHDSWLELSPTRKVSYWEFRRFVARCDPRVWREVKEHGGPW